ncbi:MAG: DUF4931 domain-containing protein [Nitrospinota bacterium]
MKSRIIRDDFLKRMVIVAPARADRPIVPKGAKGKADCPFCEQHEFMTPPESIVVGRKEDRPNQSGWQIRVFPNLYPIVSNAFEDSGYGYHDLIVETPIHDENFAMLRDQTIENIFIIVKKLFKTYKKDPKIQSTLFFKNHKSQAGASIEHPHSQTLAIASKLPLVEAELKEAAKFFKKRNYCYFCDQIRLSQLEKRMIGINDSFILFTPIVQRFRHESWIMPIRHSSRFELCHDSEFLALAKVLKFKLTQLQALESDCPFNIILYNGPVSLENDDCYHWRLEILPRIERIAAFEINSNIYINSLTSIESAELLRKGV